MRKINIVGEIFKNNKGLEFIVLEEIRLMKTPTEYYYKIKFLKSGSVRLAEKRNLRKGSVTDEYDKTIYGVACKGDTDKYDKASRFYKLAFKRWYGMIERCYNKNSIGFKSYGAKGAIVSDRWLCFANFIDDLEKVTGFDNDKYINGTITLDKDLLVEGNKEYSVDKCIFVESQVNKRNQVTRFKPFRAISPCGDVYEFNSQTECARTFNLTARSIGKVLNNQLNHHKGWKFEYK